MQAILLVAIGIGHGIRPIFYGGGYMNSALRTVILVLVILLLLGTLPTWPYSQGWGYYPSGGLGLVLIILIVLLVAGKL
jgi:hypothetical protein